MKNALIADIQRASIHDGPGLRTTVFFKGCPLSCRWCHNPECISASPEVLLYPEKCIGCGRCDEGCYTGARVLCGKEYTKDELLSEIMLDKPYYGEEGGVTFSGGEPLSSARFLEAMIDACHKNGIKCAVETSMYLYDEEVFKKLDLVMADLKIWDDELHRKYTGVSNEKIKENFVRLSTIGIPVIARTPVIPEIEQGIDDISKFLKSLPNVIQYELLPYHPLGESKRRALGKESNEFSVPTKEFMKEKERYVFIRKQITCNARDKDPSHS